MSNIENKNEPRIINFNQEEQMNEKLNEFIFKLKRPCIFKNVLQDSEASKWNLENLVDVFKDEKQTFRIGKISNKNHTVQFENQCDYVDATISQFLEWLDEIETNFQDKKRKLNIESDAANISFEENPFKNHDRNLYWAYCDYKHMIEFVKSKINTFNENCINWNEFGFKNRNANDSTLWIGTKDAYTPCHYDSYGYNLVAQIYGKKRWIMFPQEDKNKMYPTRIPFEESTVYSQININSPNLERFPLFRNVTPYIVELEPGDVLYVPHNWWHYVESLSHSISINTWVELEDEDDYCRLKEIISKSLVQGLMESNMVGFESWVNSSESYCPQEDNMEMIGECTNKIINNESETKGSTLLKPDYEQIIQSLPIFNKFVQKVSFDEYIKLISNNLLLSEPENVGVSQEGSFSLIENLSNAVCDPEVVDLITKKFLNNTKLSD